MNSSNYSEESDDDMLLSMTERFERIETSIAHLQHDLESLNSSLTALFRRLLEMDERFVRIEHELESSPHQPLSQADLTAERPPHY